MTHPTTTMILSSRDPYNYLLNMSIDEYGRTSVIPSAEKTQIVEKIMESTTDEQIIEIARHLMALELQCDSQNPLRSGNRLLPQLIRGCYARDTINFNIFHKQHGGDFQGYAVPQLIKNLWSILKNAAQAKLEEDELVAFERNGLKTLPTFYYQQLLEAPVNLARNGQVVEALNDAISSKNHDANQRLNQSISDRLDELKTHILATKWQVGDYLLFKGGVDYVADGGVKVRMPHRVKDILVLIDNYYKNDDDERPTETYKQIMELAQQALDKPRRGRKQATTDFYQDIVNYEIFAPEYELNKPSYEVRSSEGEALLKRD